MEASRLEAGYDGHCPFGEKGQERPWTNRITLRPADE